MVQTLLTWLCAWAARRYTPWMTTAPMPVWGRGPIAAGPSGEPGPAHPCLSGLQRDPWNQQAALVNLGQNQGFRGAGCLPANQGGTGCPQGPGRPDTPRLCSQEGKSPGPGRGGGRQQQGLRPLVPPLPGSGSQLASRGRHVAWPLSAGRSVLRPSPHTPGENSLKCAAEDRADGLESWVRPPICTANELMA